MTRQTLLPIKIGIFCLLALFLSGCGETVHLEQGVRVPGFELPRLDAVRPISFPEDLRGRVVALRFWADWCPFCEGEMRELEPVYRRYRDRGLEILAVNVRQDRKTVRAFVDPLGISYTVLLDEEGSVARRYGVIGLPSTLFVDREGRLQARILGESTTAVFEKVVNELL